MWCPKCAPKQAELDITNSFNAGPAGKTAAARCLVCGTKYTLVTVIAAERPTRGNGYYAMAGKLRASYEAGRKVLDL